MSETAKKYRITLSACYIGYVTQAAIVNMPPLLFIVFSQRFGISLDRLSLLITVNFMTQMLVDLFAGKIVPRIGYRVSAVLAGAFSAAGLILLGVLPLVMSPYAGLIIAFLTMALGGGLVEVIVSPVVDSLPSDNKSAGMSLLHSFYCWGSVGVIAFTTLMNALLPDGLWYLIPVLWAVIPLVNIVLFCLCPLPDGGEAAGGSYKKLFASGLFWLMLAIMLCGGAAEQAVAQWASLFTETGLGVDKELGDLLGAGLFAAFMGLTRTLYGIFGKRLRLKATLIVCAALNAAGLLLTALAAQPVLGFIGCALCGLSIGMAWPGTLSLASRRIPNGGTLMFALLALGGDIGCTAGPVVVGLIGSRADVLGSSLHSGLLFSAVFPIVMLLLLLLVRKRPSPAADTPAGTEPLPAAAADTEDIPAAAAETPAAAESAPPAGQTGTHASP